MADDGTQRPTPDPTVLTTEQLLREVENATKLLDSRLKGLEDVCNEKFASVMTQFALIERQRVEQKADTEKSVQTAFSAAKEAVTEQTAASDKSIQKSETGMTDQLRQLTQTFTTAIGGATESINDLKERLTSVEQQKVGRSEVNQNHERKDDKDQRFQLAVAGFAITIFLTIVVVLANILSTT